MKGKNKPVFLLVVMSIMLMGVTVFLEMKNYHATGEDSSKDIVMGSEIGEDNRSALLAFEKSSDTTEQVEEATLKEAEALSQSIASKKEESTGAVALVKPVVYDGLTLAELSDKLNRSLHSTLSGYGEFIATRSLEVGVDPYLAVAIMLHETGCSATCSSLVTSCNNVGGQKGAPGCGGGEYAAFETLEAGINSFLNNLANNYIAYGLTTPETIGPKYAASTTWASSVYNYIEKIRAA